MMTFETIRDKHGTHFKFVADIKRGNVAEYMIMPQMNDDNWKTSIINIHPKSHVVGSISEFKTDDEIMQDEVEITWIDLDKYPIS